MLHYSLGGPPPSVLCAGAAGVAATNATAARLPQGSVSERPLFCTGPLHVNHILTLPFSPSCSCRVNRQGVVHLALEGGTTGYISLGFPGNPGYMSPSISIVGSVDNANPASSRATFFDITSASHAALAWRLWLRLRSQLRAACLPLARTIWACLPSAAGG